MSSILIYFPILAQGTAMTIITWLTASIISLIFGMCFGIIGCRYLASSKITPIIRVYTFIAKGIPAYVQILITYFVLPSILNINIPGFAAATGALAFCSSGYMTEIVRSNINAISYGQWDACRVLGYSLRQTLIRIIIPQAIKNGLPALFGEFEQLLKSTSLLATIGIMELTRVGMNIISRELNPIPIYMTIACIYLFLSGILQCTIMYIENRTCYGYR